MTDFLEELEQDSATASQDALEQIRALAELQLSLEGELDRAEQKVKEVKARLEKVRGDQLPEAMAAARITDFTLDSGEKVEIKEELTCSVPAKRKGEIIAKLRDDDVSELITNTVEIDFAKGQDNLAGDVLGHAEGLGLLAKRTENVNTASLKSYLRGQLDEGADVDLSFYGAFLLRRSKIKQ